MQTKTFLEIIPCHIELQTKRSPIECYQIPAIPVFGQTGYRSPDLQKRVVKITSEIHLPLPALLGSYLAFELKGKFFFCTHLLGKDKCLFSGEVCNQSDQYKGEDGQPEVFSKHIKHLDEQEDK